MTAFFCVAHGVVQGYAVPPNVPCHPPFKPRRGTRSSIPSLEVAHAVVRIGFCQAWFAMAQKPPGGLRKGVEGDIIVGSGDNWGYWRVPE